MSIFGSRGVKTRFWESITSFGIFYDESFENQSIFSEKNHIFVPLVFKDLKKKFQGSENENQI